MRQFIVYEKEHQMASRIEPNDPKYRAMIVVGSTYDEDALRKWSMKVFGTSMISGIPQVAEAIAKGGWALLEILS